VQKFRPLKLVLVALIALTAAGTVGFHYIEHWDWFDSFYMVVITLSTVGYQEVHPLSFAGRIFCIVLITAGVALVFLMIGAATQALLEFELFKVFGKRRMERDMAGECAVGCAVFVFSGPSFFRVCWCRSLDPKREQSGQKEGIDCRSS